ncbi:MAG TPA: hypothetical protein VG842_06625 [Sediminibacterium sp.]|nr:hypothetical protein [Sediminibacterium sp.]
MNRIITSGKNSGSTVSVTAQALAAPILQTVYSHDYGMVFSGNDRLFCRMKERYISTALKLAILGGGHFGQSILTPETPAPVGRFRLIWHKSRAIKQKIKGGHATNWAALASN